MTYSLAVNSKVRKQEELKLDVTDNGFILYGPDGRYLIQAGNVCNDGKISVYKDGPQWKLSGGEFTLNGVTTYTINEKEFWVAKSVTTPVFTAAPPLFPEEDEEDDYDDDEEDGCTCCGDED